MKKRSLILVFVISSIFLAFLTIPQEISDSIVEHPPISDTPSVKTSVNFNYEWWAAYGGANDELYYDACVDSAGNIYAVGYEAGDVLLVKYSPTGSQVWKVIWGTSSSETASSITIDSSGNLYVAANRNSDGGFYILKFNNAGQIQWNRLWGSSTSDEGHDIALDTSGYIYVTGRAYSAGASDLLLTKYDTNGNKVWDRVWAVSTSYDCGNSISIDNSNNIFVAGYTHGSTTCYAIYQANGNRLRERAVGTYHQGLSIVAGVSGECYAVYEDITCTATLIKLSPLLNIVWSRTLISVDRTGIDRVGDTLYVCVTHGARNYFKVYKITTDNSLLGELQWDAPVCEYETRGWDICVDTDGSIYIPGTYEPCGENYQAMLVKFGNDADEDGLTDYQENNIYFTDPYDTDSDNDNWLDAEEVLTYFTDPNVPNIPAITIIMPSGTYGKMRPEYTISIIAITVADKWYTIDGGITNRSCSLSGYIDWDDWEQYGNATIKVEFYAEDTRGNIGYNYVFIDKFYELPADDDENSNYDPDDFTPSHSSSIPSYDLAILLFISAIACLIIIIRKGEI